MNFFPVYPYYMYIKFLQAYYISIPYILFSFGHDHVGHGKSDGKRVYIESVDHYVDDVIQHCMKMAETYPDLPTFIIGHSMGGMITLRAVLRFPSFFNGMILNGPLIVPGPQVKF